MLHSTMLTKVLMETSLRSLSSDQLMKCSLEEIWTFYNNTAIRPAQSVIWPGKLLTIFDKVRERFICRQSLYVKFDPLIGGRPSVMGRPSVAPYKAASAIPDSLIDMNSPIPCKQGGNISQQADETIQETVEEDTEEIRIREKEFQEGLMHREQKLVELQKELETRSVELSKLKEELKKKLDSENQMKEIVAEYEKTISELIADKEKEKDSLQTDVSTMISEKNQALEDLQNVEAAFADVHRKYERTKQVVEGFKKNEEQLKTYIEEYKNKLSRQDQKYQLLKEHAEEKLEEANKEIDNISKSQVCTKYLIKF